MYTFYSLGCLEVTNLLGLGSDAPGMEVMDFSIMDLRTWEELLHRFRPKCVLMATASCPSLMQPLLEQQIPCLALCYLVSQLFLTDVQCYNGVSVNVIDKVCNDTVFCHVNQTGLSVRAVTALFYWSEVCLHEAMDPCTKPGTLRTV